ncbi:MAG: hypothetical protein QXS38_02075 [Candidatus Pacearchaeota archaeon]
MELIAYLGMDKENWGQITALINRYDWSKIILVKNKNSEEFVPSKKAEIIKIDAGEPLIELKNNIIEKLRNKIGELEVALSIASGTGKEHMALISALLSIPVGVRFVAFTKNGVEFIN